MTVGVILIVVGAVEMALTRWWLPRRLRTIAARSEAFADALQASVAMRLAVAGVSFVGFLLIPIGVIIIVSE